MNDSLWDSLMVEVGDIFPQSEVFQHGRPTRSRLERVLVVGNYDALICRQ
jgi:hypothetical protein